MPWSENGFHSLRLNDLSLQVRLGCTAEERAIPQEVRLSVEFRFAAPPHAIKSDDLPDTVCYARISTALRAHCEAHEFQLIERLTGECLGVVRSIVEDRAAIGLRVHKVRPPVEGLLGGAIYSCGDFQV